MLSYAWMRERFQKNRKENNQEDQISELAFNFPRALQSWLFMKMGSPCSPRKIKKKKQNRNEKKKKEK